MNSWFHALVDDRGQYLICPNWDLEYTRQLKTFREKSNSVIRIIESETSCLITYPFIHIMFNCFHKLRKRIAHDLLGGHIGEIIIDLRVIDVDIITRESEAEGHFQLDKMTVSSSKTPNTV